MAFWEQVKDKTQALQIKLRMAILENQVDAGLLRLGSRTYELSKKELPVSEDGEARSLFEEISSRKEELARLREEFQRTWREEFRVLKSNLEKGDGALEPVEVSPLSPAAGRKIREIQLPREVLLGPVLRGEELIIPEGETVLRAGDRVTVMGKRKDVEETVRLLKGLP